ncbi:hypothetical protein M2404_002558 [Rheinheimera pacifica]|nr:hypothetical protein [Rheinheimera pacifica]
MIFGIVKAAATSAAVTKVAIASGASTLTLHIFQLGAFGFMHHFRDKDY